MVEVLLLWGPVALQAVSKLAKTINLAALFIEYNVFLGKTQQINCERKVHWSFSRHLH